MAAALELNVQSGYGKSKANASVDEPYSCDRWALKRRHREAGDLSSLSRVAWVWALSGKGSSPGLRPVEGGPKDLSDKPMIDLRDM